MIDPRPDAQPSAQQGRTIPIQERSVRVGDVIVVNGYRAKRSLLTARFAEGGYQVHETRHFLLFTRRRAEADPGALVCAGGPPHEPLSLPGRRTEAFWGYCIESGPGGTDDGDRGGCTFYTDEVRRAWNYFGANTLQRLLTLVSSTVPVHLPDYGSLGASATLYQRVIELAVGERFLDAACNGGYFPLLLAERIPFVREVVGVDRDAHVFNVAQDLARERHLTTVRYVQADLLADDFSAMGNFDTVTALHVLEHFSEPEMYRVLENLLLR